jgi:chromosome segregation ATPase
MSTRTQTGMSEACSGAAGNAASTSTTAAMSLWHKFANWQNETEQCRTEVRNVRQQQEFCLAEINELRRIRDDEQKIIEQFKQQEDKCISQKLHRQEMLRLSTCTDSISTSISESLSSEPTLGLLRELQQQLDVEENTYRNSTAALQKIKQKEYIQTSIYSESLRQTIEESHAFRRECDEIQIQLRATAATAGVVPSTSDVSITDWEASIRSSSMLHTLRAALHAMELCNLKRTEIVVGLGDEWKSEMLNDLENLHRNSIECKKLVQPGERVDENDPSTWTCIATNDLELYNTLVEYKQQREACEIAKAEFQVLQQKYDSLNHRARDRNQQTMQLQAQLDRLCNDCSNINSEILQYRQLTIDDAALAHTYQSSMYLQDGMFASLPVYQ